LFMEVCMEMVNMAKMNTNKEVLYV